MRFEPGEVVRRTQDEVEADPAWAGFGDVADSHPPMRGWLAPRRSAARRAAVAGYSNSPTRREGADFTAEDEDRIRELAAFAGATLDALQLPDARNRPQLS
jgi:hypothetical protein